MRIDHPREADFAARRQLWKEAFGDTDAFLDLFEETAFSADRCLCLTEGDTLAAALYCLQLYCDFSGGVDLLCGVSRLFGVPMAENFEQPYFSTSLADFWRRWHISLGEWMKDYLFYPLAFSPALAKLTKKA